MTDDVINFECFIRMEREKVRSSGAAEKRPSYSYNFLSLMILGFVIGPNESPPLFRE